jgi:acyl-CoA synthetase (AMP-forming)/AMP-acid ligase II
MSFPDSVIQVLLTDRDRIAVEHGPRTVTRGELLAMIGRVAGGLRAAGLGPGSGVAMELDVSPESLAAYLAAYASGCRVLGVRPGLSRAQERHLIDDGIEQVLTDEAVAKLLHGPDEPVVVRAHPQDVARIIHTSGSAGRPKGCAQTYAAMSAHWSWGEWGPATADLAGRMDRYLFFGTLASAVVQDFAALCLLHGGTAVIPELDEGPLFPGVIERLRISASIMNVPRLHQMLTALREPASRESASREPASRESASREKPVDTSSLRALVVSGSPLAPHRLAEAVERLGPIVFQTYGQTETGNLALLTPDDIAKGILDAVGRPQERVEIDIRDGEIFARSPYQMSGYWGDPEQTAEVLVDGWVRTRDLGHFDDAGFLHLTGRTRDVIIVDALPVYAGPIEQVLASLPDVDQAYVVGTPDEHRGEAVHAFVVPRDGRVPEKAALSDAVRDALGESSVPKTIEFVPEAPMAPSGKPDKRALLALYPRP